MNKLYANKLYTLNDTKIPRKIQLPKLTQKEWENLNRAITSKETELVIKTLLTRKSPESDGFLGKLYQTFKELILIFTNPSQKT